MTPGRPSGRIVTSTVWLMASFALTIVSFTTATVVADRQARGIEDAATTISDNVLTATESLANVRTELRHVSALTNELARGGAAQRDRGLLDELQQARASTEESWTTYLAHPRPLVERELIGVAEASKGEMNASLDEALRLLSSGDGERSLAVINDRVRPANARTDEAVREAAALNRQSAVQAAARIVELRAAGRTWGLILDAVSAFFAVVAAYFVIRVGRRYWALVEKRSSEFELFAGRVAHDIRGPLSTVSLAMDLATHDAKIEPKTRSILERGIRTLHRVGQIVDGLLVFAAAGKPSPKDRGANVSEVIGGVVDDVSPRAEEQNIIVEYEPPDPSLVAACNPGVLESMTSNLVDNAVKYMGDALVRKVTVRAREVERSMVRIEVGDTGPGVPPEHREGIFLPHIRGAEATVPGFGLGLATVRRLAEAHEGTVGVESDIGRGSIFWFELPKRDTKVRTSPSREPTPEVRQQPSPSPS